MIIELLRTVLLVLMLANSKLAEFTQIGNLIYEYRFKQVDNCRNGTSIQIVPKLDVYYGKVFLNGYLNVTENVRFSENNMVHEFRFKQLENCKTDKLRMLLVPHLDVYYGKTYINGYLNVTENFNTFYQTRFQWERCHDLDFMCEDFQVWRLSNSCGLLNMGQQTWTSVLSSIHPRIRCPMKKGIYEIRNASADAGMILLWYPDFAKYHWRVRLQIFDTNQKECFCAQAKTYVFSYKKRNQS